jgi:predicted NodU family carbamoyl transferase
MVITKGKIKCPFKLKLQSELERSTGTHLFNPRRSVGRAVEEERLNRIKHRAGPPVKAIEYILAEAGIPPVHTRCIAPAPGRSILQPPKVATPSVVLMA